ncbi:N-acyl homoserine lactonase family protein [Luminiphilus sp.]|nr:N-acyl homoserine lactonase family protein [Luminiphilus sp.]
MMWSLSCWSPYVNTAEATLASAMRFGQAHGHHENNFLGMSMSRLLILFLSMGLIACQQQSDTAGNTGSAEMAASADAAGPKLYVFDCGRIRLVSVEAFNLKETDTDVRELSAPCYVVDHPKGQLLWDAGLPSVLAQTDGWVTREDGVANWLEETLASQMARMSLGFDMSSLEYVAFSHIHWDHVGASNDVASGTWLVQQGDYDAAHAEGNLSVPAVQAELLVGIKERPTQVLNGDHDVFGDGTVQLIAADGHTPGHQVLFVDLAETGPVVLSGDLYHFQFSRANRVVPLFNVDAERTLQSMDKVEALVAETGADFWLQHDASLFDSQQKAPGVYQ